jgi:hypothetical protein
MRKTHDGDEHPEDDADGHGEYGQLQRDEEPFENEIVGEVVENRIPSESPIHDGLTVKLARQLVTRSRTRGNLGKNGVDQHGDKER